MKSNRGSILIIVFFVLSTLSVTALSFAYRASLQSRIIRDRATSTQIRYHLGSVIDIAISRIASDNNQWDHSAESWCKHDDLSIENWISKWSVGSNNQPQIFEVEYRVEDEQGKLNLCFASSDQMETIGMNEQQIACVFDWMDQDDVRRAQGAENGYYERLNRPYKAKNSQIEVPAELINIKNISKTEFYGDDLSPGSLSAVTNTKNQSADYGLAAVASCFGDGKININTAPEAVLKTLPISETAVEQIIGYRHYDDATSDELENHVFVSAEHIEMLQGLTDSERQMLSGMVVFKSNFLRVIARCTHIQTGLCGVAEAYVCKTDDNVSVINFKVIR